MPAPVRVFLVDDSALALVMMQRALGALPDIEVVGTARNGAEALQKLAAARPDVICTDYQMPGMDGLEFTRQAMAKFPRPILVVSGAIGTSDSATIFSLLEAGAVDVFAKPAALTPGSPAVGQLAEKIKQLSRIAARRQAQNMQSQNLQSQNLQSQSAAPRIGHTGSAAALPTGLPTGLSAAMRPPRLAQRISSEAPRIVVIGASTGGPQALQSVFSELPAHFSLPVLCVQHISHGFLESMVKWLDSQCRLKVRLLEEGEMPKAGTIYFPQEDTHLEIGSRGQLCAGRRPPAGGHRPSVTVAFQSVARYYGGGVLGVLLTGMGKDGAEGLRTIAEAGGATIAQDEASSVVFGMPREAIELGAAQHILPLNQIAAKILHLTARKPL